MGFPKGDPELERGPEFYDNAYRSALRHDGRYARPWVEQPARTVTYYPALLMAEPPIFDVGCGGGHLAAMCADFNIAYFAGIDSSQAAVKLARRLAPTARFETVSAFEAKTLLHSKKYRTVMLLEVLEHVFNDLQLLRLIPKDRPIVASVPSFHTEGHVRWFSNKQEVQRRYSWAMNIERIVTERGQSGGHRWHIFKGTRK